MNVAGALRWAANGRLLDLLAPGLYAWAVTVAWPVSQRFAPLPARLFALAGGLALIAGAVLSLFSPALSRAVGIWLFVASCVAAWAFVEPAIAPSHLDPVQGILGSVGWGLFAVGWAGRGTTGPSAAAPESATSPSEERPARRAPLGTASLALAVVASAAAVPMMLAWRVASVERALLAHVIAIAAAIGLMAFAAQLFDPRASRAHLDRPEPSRRLLSAAPSLGVALALALLGALYALVR